MSDETAHAIKLANKVLDRINADPDDDLAVLSRQLLRTREALTDALRQRDEESAIVSRIWNLLGNPSYEELKGRSIYDCIIEMRAERDNAVAQVAVMVDAVQDILDRNEIQHWFNTDKQRQALSSIGPQATAMLKLAAIPVEWQRLEREYNTVSEAEDRDWKETGRLTTAYAELRKERDALLTASTNPEPEKPAP